MIIDARRFKRQTSRPPVTEPLAARQTDIDHLRLRPNLFPAQP